MTDVASLSFQIDSSNVQQAVDQLNKLSDASDKVRGSTRFLVSNFGDSAQALTQLASTGRASLASFVQISENLDTITGRLNALRLATAETINTFGNQQLTSALTTFQQQFEAMSTLFGSSAAQLEEFNKQATYLGMNSYQVTSALQRITEAMKNMTPAGQAIRGVLNSEGINTGGSASDILRQVVQYAQTHAQTQQAFNTLQAVVGPIDPATYAALVNPGYRTISQQRDMFNSATLGVEASNTSSAAARLSYQNLRSNAQFSDVNQNFSLGGQVDQRAILNALQEKINQQLAQGNTAGARADKALYDQLRGADPGSQNAINAEGQFLSQNPWSRLSIMDRTVSGLGELLTEPMGGKPTMLSRALDPDLVAANANFIRQNYAARSRNLGWWDFGGRISTGLGNDRDALLNLIGDYSVPKDSALENIPFGAADRLQQDQSDAATAAQFGYSGFGQVLGAQQNLLNLQAGGPNSIGQQLARLFGQPEGSAILRQQIGAQQFIASNAATPGFDQLQQLRTAGFLAGQGAGSDEAQALIQYAQGLKLDPGQWATGGAGGTPLTMSQILAGAGPTGAALTPGERTAFGNIWSQALSNTGVSQNTQFQQQSALGSATISAAQGASSTGNYQAEVAGLQAYYASMARVNDVTLATSARIHAYTLELEQQSAAAARATADLRLQNESAGQGIAAGGAALATGRPGAYGASQSEADIQSKLAAFRNSYTGTDPVGAAQRYETQLRQSQQQGIISGAQDALSSTQTQGFSVSAQLSTFGSGFDARNRAETELDFASQLQSATGDTKGALEKLIDSIVSAKDNLDGLNVSLSDLQSGMSGFRTAADYQAVMRLPGGQQAAALSALQAQGAIQNLANVGITQGPYRYNNPMDLNYLGQPGAVGRDPNNNVAIFATPGAGMAADTNQVKLDLGRGLNTLNKLIPKYGPPSANDTAGYIKHMSQILGLDPNATITPDMIPHFIAAMGDLEGVGSGIGVYAGSGAFASTTAQQAFQGQQIGFSMQAGDAATRAALPFLSRGQTGAATIARAGIVSQSVPDPEKTATIAAQLTAAIDQLKTTAAGIAADASIKASDAKTMAAAYLQGPGAVISAQAMIDAQASGRAVGDAAGPGFVAAQYQANLAAARANADQNVASATARQTQDNSVSSARLTNAATIADPYQREIADSNAQIAEQLKTTFAGSTKAMQDQYAAAAQTATQLDIIAQKQQVVAQGMGQIGSSVEDTLGNLAFSYQYGPGQGLFARKQISGLLASGARSLFNTVVGNPISNFVTGNLNDAVESILGLQPGSGPSAGASGSAAGTGASGSAASNALGGISGILSNSLLARGLGALPGLLFGSAGSVGSMSTAALIAHQGGAALAGAGAVGSGATAAAPGILSSIGSWLSGFFATGAAFDAGRRIPFANGGAFSGGRRMFATGDVFSDPTTMPMALLGEAGPEAIMPLRRGADGKLGVAASNAGGGATGPGSVVIHAPITIGQGALQGNGSMDAAKQRALQRQIHQVFTRGVQAAMAEQSRPGGMIQPQY